MRNAASGARKTLVETILVFLIASMLAIAAKGADAPDQAASTFKAKCSLCHGQTGNGDTSMGKSLKVPDLHSPVVQKQSAAQLQQVITEGKNNMPSFKDTLSPEEINSMAAFVHKLGAKKAPVAK